MVIFKKINMVHKILLCHLMLNSFSFSSFDVDKGHISKRAKMIEKILKHHFNNNNYNNDDNKKHEEKYKIVV